MDSLFLGNKNSLLTLLVSLLCFSIPFAEPFSWWRKLGEEYPALGVNFGQMADNLPPPAEVAGLVQKTRISKVRVYGTDPQLLRAFANTGIGLWVTIGNEQIDSLAQPHVAESWVRNQIAPFLSATNIIGILLGNEVLLTGDASQLLPALQNLHTALAQLGLDKQIKVSTPHSLAILSTSFPPSAGRFKPEYESTLMKPLLEFLAGTGSPFMINPYPYFAYKKDPSPQTLAYALFQDNPGVQDPHTGLHYSNMLDAMVDAVYSAVKSLGFPHVEIVIAETGWPSHGGPDEPAATIQNAAVYNGNLIKHVISKTGTPLIPNHYIETFIFSLFNEDQKSGPASEQHFGLFNPDMTAAYDVGLLHNQDHIPSEASGRVWCIAKPGVDNQLLQHNIDYACGQEIDCGPIQPGGSCYNPNTLAFHASYAMNAYYQSHGRNSWNCDFRETAMITTQNPSYGECAFPSS